MIVCGLYWPDFLTFEMTHYMLYIADVGCYSYGASHPMKPHRMKMTHELVSAYNMLDKMTVTVSIFHMTDQFHLDGSISCSHALASQTCNGGPNDSVPHWRIRRLPRKGCTRVVEWSSVSRYVTQLSIIFFTHCLQVRIQWFCTMTTRHGRDCLSFVR